ncbi:hypothetical protein [Bacillus haynesii]|uniref:hypothetical protein n=1 Tax=Bacillus haynesii TaxID=1925021 RepID=UPI0039901C8C
MNDAIQMYFRNLESDDRQLQYEAYQHILSLTEKEVDWAYEVWDQLIKDLDDKDNQKDRERRNFSLI